jgi:dynein heavy chain 2, cytosolic
VQVEKMLQLHACRQQRVGVILMGPSGSGKSTLWRVLAAAYRHVGRPPVVYCLNPKAMPRQQLLGFMDSETRCGTRYTRVSHACILRT